MKHLSNIEVFYSNKISDDQIKLESEEFNHCIKVFRKKINDDIYTTDGMGNLFKTQIIQIKNNSLITKVIDKFYFSNSTERLFICIPLLKNKDRFRFVIEKSVELGITRFCFFKSDRSIPTRFDEEKIRKIMIESLKQSIRTHLPKFYFFHSFPELYDRIISDGEIFVFEIESEQKFNKELISPFKNNYFIFGPEGGLSKNELESLNKNRIFSLSTARLRTETAIIKLVSIIT